MPTAKRMFGISSHVVEKVYRLSGGGMLSRCSAPAAERPGGGGALWFAARGSGMRRWRRFLERML